ncbi:MAG: bifunctional folylpolyglutamate synthase/dihydrofolate synthase [Pseudomonadota bacterium]
MASPGSAVDWVASLSPWPADFGLDRMRALLAELGDPQRAFRSVHVVGTNGKSTATRTVEAHLLAAGLRTGAYLSPHVRGWGERIRVDGEEADVEEALARVRPAVQALEATQFEALTAAAFAAFAEEGVEAAAVEAGLGGRLDATNVVDAPVVLLTNVSLEHTEVLGDTREAIAREKLAVAHAARVVVLPDREFAALAPPEAEVLLGGAREAAAAFLGREPDAIEAPVLPGRLERRGDEVRDGAHNPAGARWLADRLAAERPWVVVASVLRDKDVDGMLRELARLGDVLVATESGSTRVLPADELAAAAAAHFGTVATAPDPLEALALAREQGPRVVVTGSLYLLAALAEQETGAR